MTDAAMASGVVAMMPPSAETPIVRPVTVAYSSARNHVTANRRIARKDDAPAETYECASQEAHEERVTHCERHGTEPHHECACPGDAARAVPIYKHPGGQLHGSVEVEK